jgi:chorismate mutase
VSAGAAGMASEMVAAEAAIERLRGNIDTVDEVLVKLLNQRALWALEIGRVKKRVGMAIYQPDREARVVAHVVRVNRGPLAADAVQRLFERVIDESRRLERTAEGPAGSLETSPAGSLSPGDGAAGREAGA